MRDCLEKDPSERTENDVEILLGFTQNLKAFTNMTLTVRRALCSVMVFAVVEKAGTIVMNDAEELDSWSVLINGVVEIEIQDLPEKATLLDFITAVVTQQVEVYNAKKHEQNVLPFLTSEQIEDGAVVGKIGFGAIYSEEKANLEKAIANAIVAFEDGLYKVFIDEEEMQNIDNEIFIYKESVVMFLRLTLIKTY